MRNPRHQSPKSCEFFRFDQKVLGLLQIVQRRFGRIPRVAELSFARPQRSLRALAFGDLFCGNVDADDFAAWAAQRMPISDPKPLVGLVGALAGNLDANYRLAGLHDQANGTASAAAPATRAGTQSPAERPR